MFKKFKKQVQQNFDKLAVDHLFYSEIDRNKIIDVYLRRQGRQPRPDEILNAYKAKLSAGNN